MSLKLGIVMDPITDIRIHKDTSFALLLAAQKRQHTIYYMEPQDIWLRDRDVYGKMRLMEVEEDPSHWHDFRDEIIQPLKNLDVLLMRKDPPFNMEYIYLTYLLELAEAEGLLVINRPQALRDANEKIYARWFPQCCPPTLIASQPELLRQFIHEEKEAVIKPLGAMAGQSIFHIRAGDDNIPVIIETLTRSGTRMAMLQRFIPEIKNGDKRIILINGNPIPYALARIPQADDFRGNLAAGAKGVGRPLTERDLWICEQVGPTLRDKGLWFVGLDVIGDFLTEINVTSPTGVRELEAQFGIDIGGALLDLIVKKIAQTNRHEP